MWDTQDLVPEGTLQLPGPKKLPILEGLNIDVRIAPHAIARVQVSNTTTTGTTIDASQIATIRAELWDDGGSHEMQLDDLVGYCDLLIIRDSIADFTENWATISNIVEKTPFVMVKPKGSMLGTKLSLSLTVHLDSDPADGNIEADDFIALSIPQLSFAEVSEAQFAKITTDRIYERLI